MNICEFKGMRTVGQIKHDRQIHNLPKQDSIYDEASVDRVREARPSFFKPLHVPAKLQRDLPYALKPKNVQDMLDLTLEQESGRSGPKVSKVRDMAEERVRIEVSRSEQKVNKVMNMIRSLAEDKADQEGREKHRRMGEVRKRARQIEERKWRKQKASRQFISKVLTQQVRREQSGHSRRDPTAQLTGGLQAERLRTKLLATGQAGRKMRAKSDAPIDD